ncbi:MAG: hypothetical protein LBR77_00740 [Lachnospiraceae bacterium]|jgi:hypothetical protein|nr:hypothetical protein [Lachnospiraceae bacterium]
MAKKNEEIKSPLGNSKRSVERQMKRASRQSQNIVYDARRTSMPDDMVENRIRYEMMNGSSSAKRVILIKKTLEVLGEVEFPWM